MTGLGLQVEKFAATLVMFVIRSLVSDNICKVLNLAFLSLKMPNIEFLHKSYIKKNRICIKNQLKNYDNDSFFVQGSTSKRTIMRLFNSKLDKDSHMQYLEFLYIFFFHICFT